MIDGKSTNVIGMLNLALTECTRESLLFTNLPPAK